MTVMPLRVLVVEDDEEDFILAKDLLESVPGTPMEAEWAPGYDEAMAKAVAGTHDVLLVDYQLGPRTGLAWMEEAHARGVRAPIILLTGYNSDRIDAEAITAGASDYLVKGRLDATQLGRSIRYALDRARAREQFEMGMTQYRALFQNAPTPMWVYDRQTLKFLAVNQAAVQHYGYSESQFLDMTLLDIRPEGDHAAVIEATRNLPAGLVRSGPWRHRCVSGDMIDVQVASHDIQFDGRPARFTVINDITLQLRAERLIRDSARQLRQVLADVGDALIVVGGDQLVRFANPAAGALWQVPGEQLEGYPLPLEIEGEHAAIDIVRPDGQRRRLDVRRTDTTWSGEQAQVLTLRDDTERLATEERLRLLKRAIRSTHNGVTIAEVHPEGSQIIFANQAFEEITGYPQVSLLGAPYDFVLEKSGAPEGLDQLREALRQGEDCDFEFQGSRPDGSTYWAQIAITPVRETDGAVTHLIAILTDTTERRNHESELAQLARRDPVTELPLFLAIDDYVRQAIASADESGTRVAMYFIDFDRFNLLNENFGHAVGDSALRAGAERLRASLGSHGVLARLAGDKFVAVVPVDDAVPNVRALGDRLRASLNAPLTVDPYEMHLSVTIGVSLYPDHAATATDLINAAEMAMTRGKRGGRGTTMVYLPEYGAELRDRIELGSRLRHGIEHGELVLHFQPMISGLDGGIIGAEALVRWNVPGEGLVMPARFVQVAEELGLIVPLGQWVLNAACAQLRQWHDAGFTDTFVAINVSPYQLVRDDFVLEVQQALEFHGLKPAHLELELTESALMETVDHLVAVLQELKELGVRLALDDFGTGYSSLNYLRRLPIDKIKIDRGLLTDIGAGGTGDAAIARAVIAMGHQMRMTVLAEGVDTEAQLGYLRRNHCDQFQGYLFSKPVDAAAMTRLLRHRFLVPQGFEATHPERVLLLVDDEENVLRSLLRLFRRDGYKVLTAASPDDAMGLLARNNVQVILSDQRMPGTSGTEFLGKVKDLYPDTVRLVLSGYTDLATVTDAINRGAIYRFLTKPWVEDELREHIREAFRTQEEARSLRVTP